MRENPFIGEALQMHSYAQGGMLPFAGGVMDQPVRLMRAIGIVGSEISAIWREKK